MNIDSMLRKSLGRGEQKQQFKPKDNVPIKIADGKKVYYYDTTKVPSHKTLHNIYKKIPDDKNIPIVIQTKKQYLNEYIKNQELSTGRKFTKEEKVDYVNSELKRMKGVVSRYTTKDNKYIDPRIVFFSDRKWEPSELKFSAHHEYAHELVEAKPEVLDKYSMNYSPKRAVTPYGATDVEEDFADRYAMNHIKDLRIDGNPVFDKNSKNRWVQGVDAQYWVPGSGPKPYKVYYRNPRESVSTVHEALVNADDKGMARYLVQYNRSGLSPRGKGKSDRFVKGVIRLEEELPLEENKPYFMDEKFVDKKSKNMAWDIKEAEWQAQANDKKVVAMPPKTYMRHAAKYWGDLSRPQKEKILSTYYDTSAHRLKPIKGLVDKIRDPNILVEVPDLTKLDEEQEGIHRAYAASIARRKTMPVIVPLHYEYPLYKEQPKVKVDESAKNMAVYSSPAEKEGIKQKLKTYDELIFNAKKEGRDSEAKIYESKKQMFIEALEQVGLLDGGKVPEAGLTAGSFNEYMERAEEIKSKKYPKIHGRTEDTLLEVIKTGDGIKRSDIMERMDISETTLNNYLAKLERDKKIVASSERGYNKKYFDMDKGNTDLTAMFPVGTRVRASNLESKELPQRKQQQRVDTNAVNIVKEEVSEIEDEDAERRRKREYAAAYYKANKERWKKYKEGKTDIEEDDDGKDYVIHLPVEQAYKMREAWSGPRSMSIGRTTQQMRRITNQILKGKHYPIKVYEDDFVNGILTDGRHRILAYEQLGYKRIPVDVVSRNDIYSSYIEEMERRRGIPRIPKRKLTYHDYLIDKFEENKEKYGKVKRDLLKAS